MGLNSVVTQVVSRYNDIFTHADPRMQNYLLMSSPFPVFGLCFIYVYFVLHLGPKFMADRKPYNLRIVLVVYNALQTIFSAVMFYEVGSGCYFCPVSAFWIEHYGFFRCIRVDSTSETPTSLKVQFGMIMIYILVACIMCSQNRHLVTLTLVLDAAFVFLFLDFYRKAYRGKKGTKEMEIERVTDSSQIRKMNTGTGEKVLEMRNQIDTNGKVLGMRKRF
ncbi:hypothetical protein RUM43_009496 [Polyplax serrata]|uniref:Elongation of very long chain fatty acids protein n=1 Tax=Polyplax serrata TaxID=468196 RepID=A0AAN8RUG6_POLSC